jgi:hypothetical protein
MHIGNKDAAEPKLTFVFLRVGSVSGNLRTRSCLNSAMLAGKYFSAESDA